MHEQGSNKRRSLLLGAGAAGAAAAVGGAIATAAPDRGATPVESVDEAAAVSKGYRLSEHIRNYYRTSRI